MPRSSISSATCAAASRSATLKLEGIDAHAGSSAHIDFQNEFLTFERAGRIEVCVPDLIVILDVDTGHAITTDVLRYGQRVAVLALPCHPLLRTPEALAVVGPHAFGLERPGSTAPYRDRSESLPHESLNCMCGRRAVDGVVHDARRRERLGERARRDRRDGGEDERAAEQNADQHLRRVVRDARRAAHHELRGARARGAESLLHERRRPGSGQRRDPRRRLAGGLRNHRHLSRRRADQHCQHLHGGRDRAALLRCRPHRGAAWSAGYALWGEFDGRHHPLREQCARIYINSRAARTAG